ncbi:OmpP1/FadL family transporter [Paucibacter sp. KCTC 42545]|uniref:OmpP1/FadL family transporter n=1 Tax=Paucibacter sp. KCTC 42545 TaxID=1768242 RepID=UPI000733C15B|nr:OmpP1/FadL family transporter [Paucibacter sp. KCTC 42545]ALT78888.1 hypothetical protein AT984_18540 [Paucibacter sp. KCTC 42545]
MRFVQSTLGLALLALIGGAQASGYHFGSQSASAQGTANANGAEATDASGLFYNPAASARLKGTQASGVLNVVIPTGKFEDQGSTTAAGLPIKGSDGGKFVATTAVPHAYLSHQLSDSLSLGFGMFVPFGSKSEYSEDWTGRYNSIGTELKTIALNPSLAFKVNEKLTFGGGLTAQRIEGKLSKGADFGSGVLASLPAAALSPKLIQELSGNPKYSGRVDVEGTDWGFGYNLGLMYNYDENTRFGVAYRSAIGHKLSGTAKWQVQTPATNIAAVLNGIKPGLGNQVQTGLIAKYAESDASLAVDTPESLSFNFFKQQDKLAVMGDLTVTRHSRFSELRVNFAKNANGLELPDSVTPENWINTIRASFGVNYQWSDQLKLRGGLAFDQSPVKLSTRTPSIPDNDRIWVSGGFNWKLSNKSSFDVALSYINIAAAQVNNYDNGGVVNASGSSVCDATKNTSSCATVRGRYTVSSALLGLQYNHQF